MRVLYCAIDQTVPGTNGGSVHVTAVAEGLAALGHEVHVANDGLHPSGRQYGLWVERIGPVVARLLAAPAA